MNLERPQRKEVNKDLTLMDWESFNRFETHPWVQALKSRYQKDAILALHATDRLYEDLTNLNQEYLEEHGRDLFTKVEQRVKTPRSFFKKLWRIATRDADRTGITPETLAEIYGNIKDLAGVRFACPYFDEVEIAVNRIVRPKLKTRGYAVNLQDNPALHDHNWLESGDEAGYRSYHFYVRVPTEVNIYRDVQLVLCEVQGRSELQHVWAVKSHYLLYNRHEEEWNLGLERDDMKQLSNSLRAADQFLISIRARVTKKKRTQGR